LNEKKTQFAFVKLAKCWQILGDFLQEKVALKFGKLPKW
jgi:hypothetical protein